MYPVQFHRERPYKKAVFRKKNRMLRYMELVQNPRRFLALTGYTVDEFRALLSFFRVRFQASVARFTLEGKPRQHRTYSTYKNSTFPSTEDKLLFILNYMKTYPIQQTQAQLFGIQQSQANQWIHLLLPLVKQALADCGELPARKKEDMHLDEDNAGLFVHDGTERPINRPQDPEQQRLYYSGKQRKHTVKNDMVIDEPCKIHFLSETVEGKKNDKRLADESGYGIPQDSVLVQDAGFQGFHLDGVSILQPKKKPRGGALGDADKVRNRLISGIRVRIEHTIASVKRYRVVKDKSRNWKPAFRDLAFEICCGLHNFRLNFRPWHYKPIPYLNCLLNS
jgi:DDE superfamily endonuclease/Helix-turn-helix of DDE superfamily endonuclease